MPANPRPATQPANPRPATQPANPPKLSILKHPTPRRKSPRSKPLVLSRRLCLWHTASASPYCLRQYGLWNRPIACGNTGGLGGAIGPIRPIRTAFFLLHPARKAFTTHKKTPPKPALSHGERGACFTKNKKSPHPKPDLTPSPSPMGRGERAS